MGHSQNYEGTSKKWQNGRQDSAPTGVAKNFGKTKPMSYFEKHKMNLMLAEQAAKEKGMPEANASLHSENLVEEPKYVPKQEERQPKQYRNYFEKHQENMAIAEKMNPKPIEKHKPVEQKPEPKQKEKRDKKTRKEEPAQKESKSEAEPSKKIHIIHKLRKDSDRSMRDLQQDIIMKQSTIKTQREYEDEGQKYNITLKIQEPVPRKTKSSVAVPEAESDFDIIIRPIETVKYNVNISANALADHRKEWSTRIYNDLNRLHQFTVDALGHNKIGQDEAGMLWKSIQQNNVLTVAEVQGLLYIK